MKERRRQGALGVNHIEISLFHTPLQLKPNLCSSSRTSVMFGCGSLPSAPLLSSPLLASPLLLSGPLRTNPPTNSLIHLLHISSTWEEAEEEDEGSWRWEVAYPAEIRALYCHICLQVQQWLAVMCGYYGSQLC